MKIYFIIFLFCFSSFAQKTEIKDPNLKAWFIKKHPTCLTGKDSSFIKSNCKEIKTIETVNLSGLGIQDLSGIQCFENVYSLHLNRNNITDITVLSKLKKMLYLNLDSNKLETIEVVIKMENLRRIKCASNKLTSLPDFRYTKINDLKVAFNPIAKIQDLHQTNIDALDCSYTLINKLPKLNPELFYLNISGCNLTDSIVIRNYPKLKYLLIANCKLHYVPDISSCKELNAIYLNNNNIDVFNLDLSKNVRLNYIDLSGNQLREVPQTKPPSLDAIIDLRRNPIKMPPPSEHVNNMLFDELVTRTKTVKGEIERSQNLRKYGFLDLHENLLDSLLILSPDNQECLFLSADYNYCNLETINRLIKLNPNYHEALYLMRARAYYCKKNYDSTLLDLNYFFKTNRNRELWLEAKDLKLQVLLDLKDYENALTLVRNIIQICPPDYWKLQIYKNQEEEINHELYHHKLDHDK